MKILIVLLIVLIVTISISSLIMRREMLKGQNYLWKQFKKNDSIIKVLDYWMNLREQNISVASILLANGYDNVAIYGYGVLGRRLYEELKSSSVKVNYIVDKRLSGVTGNVSILSPSDSLEPTGIMIVTAIGDYWTIRKNMKEKLDCPIISLEDVIYGN
jgi:hypothetical protein